jgi:hypothetical protein
MQSFFFPFVIDESMSKAYSFCHRHRRIDESFVFSTISTKGKQMPLKFLSFYASRKY